MSENNRPFERKMMTTLSCRIAAPEASKMTDFAPDAFVTSVVTKLRAMGAAVDLDASALITADFVSGGMNDTAAERAVLAGLDLLSEKREHPQSAEFDFKIGIASGLIWRPVPQKADKAGSVFSHIVAKQASALCDHASPDSVYITEATRQFVRGLFEYRSADPLLLKSFGDPVQAFAVERSSAAENRFEALYSQPMRFVGRDRELSGLARLWRSAGHGNGQVAFITGEPGIGKSRLVHEAEHRLQTIPVSRLRLYGTPHHQNSALYPFARLIEKLCCIDRTEPDAIKAAKFESFLFALGLGPEEKTLFDSIFRLLSNSAVTPDGTNARKHLELLLQAFLRVIEALSAQGPVLMIFEDLQWADQTSSVLLGRIVKRCSTLSLMLIATARPEYKPAWGGEPAVSEIVLAPLTAPQSAAFISLVSKRGDLRGTVSDQIIEITGGVPLFMEEATKVLIESGLLAVGANPIDPRALMTALPGNIHGALLARLECIGEGKALASAASVLGRNFSYGLLEGIAGLASEDLDRGVTRLIEAAIFLRVGNAGPDADYMFKHALLQEAAYSTLPGSDKRMLHLRVARLFQSLAKQRAVEPELIAHHLTEAGESDEAAMLWFLAGQRAIAGSANPEAIEHLKSGLKCLRKVEPSAVRDQRERHMLMALGPAVLAVHGYGAAAARDVFERAAELVDETTAVPERLHILCGLWNVRNGRSELYSALSLAGQFLDLAKAVGAGLTLGNCMMGQTLAAMGDFARAQEHFNYVIAQYQDREGGPERVRFAADEHILALSYMGRVLWALGYPDQAAAATEEALTRARNGADAVSVAIAYVGQLFMATHRADIGELATKVSEAEAHCSRYGLYLFEHWMQFNRGALLVRQGQFAAGIELMRSAIAAADSRQTRNFRVFQLSCVAEAYLRCGTYKAALATADDAFQLAEKTGERMSEAGLRRLRAEILFELGRPEEGRRELEAGLQLARRQNAKLEELRIATAMAWHAAGAEQAGVAGQRLRAIYTTFEEGHGLPYLRAARDQLLALGL